MAFVIGIPKEQCYLEYRVGMTPTGVSILSAQGHRCLVEKGAGIGSGFTDAQYQQAGAQIIYDTEEIFRRSELLLKVHCPTMRELEWMADGQIVMAIMMLSVRQPEHIDLFYHKGITAIAYELIRASDGSLPILYPLSQIGGRMTAQIAAQYLQNNHGGSGILLGGIAGVPPADVVIVGAGVVGTHATQAFLGMGAHVILMDHDLHKLQIAQERFGEQITTMISYDFNLERVCKIADVVVGAVQLPGHRTPYVISRQMVQSMHPSSLIIDMSIDQGGCVETSRPTRHDNPTYVAEGVIHYCVPNVPGVVGRTATHAFLNAAWPFIKLISDVGIDEALEQNTALRQGTVITAGFSTEAALP